MQAPAGCAVDSTLHCCSVLRVRPIFGSKFSSASTLTHRRVLPAASACVLRLHLRWLLVRLGCQQSDAQCHGGTRHRLDLRTH